MNPHWAVRLGTNVVVLINFTEEKKHDKLIKPKTQTSAEITSVPYNF